MTNSNRDALGIASIFGLGIFVLLAVAGVLNGIMLSYMWQWFVVPLGVRSIGVVQAIGIAMIVSMMTSQGAADDSGDALKKLSVAFTAKIVVFGIAYGLSFLVPA